MTATHNALVGALSKFSHFDEFSDYLNVRGNILTPSQRQALARANLGAASSETLAVTAGAGITGGTGTVYKYGVSRIGSIVRTEILIDLTGLSSSTTDLDIIGQGASAAHLGQITAAINGTPFAGIMECLEAPAGGVTDIDLYFATVATGVFDGAISGLAGQAALLTSGAAWTLARRLALADPASLANGYLYLTGGAGGTAAAYTAGKFRIEILGYV